MAQKIINTKIREAYDTEANWIKHNPVLLAGQLAFSSDKYGKYKIGDGIKTWNQLEYAKTKWEDVDGKPSTFNPATHSHTPSQVGLGNVNNTADADKNVNSAKYVQDSNNGVNIAISYQDPDVKTASWFPVFVTAKKIGTISGSNLRNAIGAAAKDHLHDYGISHVIEKNTSGVRYVKIADLECTFHYHRLNQQFIFTSRIESILLTVRCCSSDNTLFIAPVISYVALSLNPSLILNNLYAGLVNTTSGKNKIEIWYKQEQYTESLNIIPIGKNAEGYALNLYSYGFADTGSTTAPTFATSIPIQSAISKIEIGLGNVDNTADSNKSVKYATSAGSATTASKLGTTTNGSSIQPIYLNNGVPVACTYTLAKSVPSNAVFTDTNTWRPIQDNLTSTSTTDSLSANQGRILKGLIDSKAPSSHSHTIANITNLQSALDGKASVSHNHDTIYAKSSHSHNTINDCNSGTSIGISSTLGIVPSVSEKYDIVVTNTSEHGNKFVTLDKTIFANYLIDTIPLKAITNTQIDSLANL